MSEIDQNIYISSRLRNKMDEFKFIFAKMNFTIILIIFITSCSPIPKDDNQQEVPLVLFHITNTTEANYECTDQDLDYTLFNQIDEMPEISKFLLENLPTRLIRFC